MVRYAQNERNEKAGTRSGTLTDARLQAKYSNAQTHTRTNTQICAPLDGA